MTEEEQYQRNLNRDDLMLLMESYRNTIQMHTTLLEQLKAVISSQHDLLSKQDDILKKQHTMCSNIETVTKDIDLHIKKFDDLNSNISTTYTNLEKVISGQTGNIETKLDDSNLTTVKNYSSLRNRIYIALVGMSLIVISLITLNITAFDKFDVLNDIYLLVLKLVEHFNLG